jgi:large subunit ribosomal protein L24
MKFGSHLSKELRKKHGTRSISVRRGDRVKVLRGRFKDTESKVERAFPRKGIVHLEKAKTKKADGSEIYFPIHMTNIIIIDIDLSDPMRKKVIDRKKVVKNAS